MIHEYENEKQTGRYFSGVTLFSQRNKAQNENKASRVSREYKNKES